jgi:hypothetical protein
LGGRTAAIADVAEVADNLSVVEQQQVDMLDDLLAPIPRKAILPAVEAALRVQRKQAEAIVQAFDDYVARPLEANLKKLRGRQLARRNPFIYTVRGIETVDEWADHVLADKETSAIEGHIGTFLEQVARIVSGGIKPGNGVDLQLEDEHGVAHLFAIQAAPNTKNSGARRSDVESLKRAARPLRANKQRVSLNIAVLSGQAKAYSLRSDSAVTILASDDFWHRVSGIPDFRARLVRASTILAWLVKARSHDEVERIKGEAHRFNLAPQQRTLINLGIGYRIGREVPSGVVAGLAPEGVPRVAEGAHSARSC